MLSTIRHFQKGIMIAIAIVVIIAFTFFGNYGDPAKASNNNAINVNGEAISDKEAIRLRAAYFVLERLGMFDFARFLYADEGRLNTDYTNFAVNLVLFREQAKQMGVAATQQEIENAKQELIMFRLGVITDEQLMSDILNPVGYTLSDLHDLLADYVNYQQIRSLLEAGIEPLDSEIDDAYVSRFATIHGSLVKIQRGELEKNAEESITDEEIAAHFETNNASYLSRKKRGVDLVRIPRPELAEDATAEAKAESAVGYVTRVDELYGQFAIDGSDFEDAAKKNELAIEKIDAFSPNEPPESLSGKFDIIEPIFAQSLTTFRPVSDPIKLNDESYVIIHLREDLEPKPLTLEEATPQIRDALKQEKLTSGINDAVAAARSTITEALKAGKPIADAAKAAGLETTPLPAFSSEEPPEGLENSAGLIAAVASRLNPGELSSDPFPFGDNETALVYVGKKELVNSPDETSRRETLRTQLIAGQTNQLMRAWQQRWRSTAEVYTHVRLMKPNGEAATEGEGDEGAEEEGSDES